MNEALQILALVVAVAVVAAASRRLGLSAPLVLVVVGLVASLVPGVPEYRIDPDIVLIGFLPPLLYAAALRTSLVDVRANRQAIGIMAVGAVVFTTLLVGLVAWAVHPWRLAGRRLALGAVVSPPDAVAATTIARRVGMPRRIVSILEGESLLNDATALVALRTATAAITRHGQRVAVAGSFVLAAGGGIVVGLAMAAVLAHGPQAGAGPGARHDPLARRAVPGLPGRRGGARQRRARCRHRRPPARAQVPGPAVGVVPAGRADQLAHHHLRPRERRLPAHRAAAAGPSCRTPPRATSTLAPARRASAWRCCWRPC